jgi:hypothetical protein
MVQTEECGSAGSERAPARKSAANIKLVKKSPDRISGDTSPILPTSSAQNPEHCGKSGKGGGTPIEHVSNAAFIAALFGSLPEAARPIISAKAGDPGEGAWFAQDARNVATVCKADLNTYVNCASVRPAADGSVTAKKKDAAAYHLVLLDDVGTKGIDLPVDLVPTWRLETSPGNFQVGYRLTTPEADPNVVEEAQRAFAASGHCDKNSFGMTRWCRLPVGINGKPKYRKAEGTPFRCRLAEWNPEVSYELGELVAKLAPRWSKPASRLRSLALRSTSLRQSFAGISGDVFTPASEENPVVTALKNAGLYKTELTGHKHDITCPWVDEHSGGDNGACFFEPSAEHPFGGFKCHHTHGDRYKLKDLLEHFELTRSDLRNRPRIRILDGELQAMVDAAQFVLSQTGEYFQSGGHIVRIGIDPMTGGVGLVPQTDADLTLVLSRLVEWERPDKNGAGKWQRANPHPNVIRLLLQMQTYEHLPTLKGIARQPMLGSDDRLVTVSGYDEPSQLYCAFDGDAFGRPEPTLANAQEALKRLRHLLREFRFATPRDEATAVAALMTAVLRPSLGRAPAFHIRAPAPGSGKSLLSDVIARFAGRGHPAKVSYPRTEVEATKVLLAALLEAPAVIDFDDMAIDWQAWGAVNRLLTSPTMTDRILGVSKMATVSTDVLVLGSGNNTGPVGDLCRRVVVIDLDTGDESPVTIRYEGDPLAEVEAKREEYVADVLLIVEAWLAAGRPCAELSPIATYGGRWSDFCRQTLVWLGLEDPAAGLIEQLREDPDRAVLGRLLTAWHEHIGEKPVTLRALLDAAEGTLIEALEDLPCVDGGPINRGKLGYYLKRNAGRPVDGLRLEKAECRERNAWRVVATMAGKGANGQPPPFPPLPPSADHGGRPDVFD